MIAAHDAELAIYMQIRPESLGLTAMLSTTTISHVRSWRLPVWVFLTQLCTLALAQSGVTSIRDFMNSVHVAATVADAQGNIYIAGYGQVQPTTGAAQSAFGGGHYDAIIAKWAPDGTRMIYAMNLGGRDDDAALAVAVDAAGNAYVTGFTYSPDFPVSLDAFQSKHANPGNPFYGKFLSYIPGGDVFVTEISADGTRLLFSTLAGGSSDEAPSAIAVDHSGNAYVTGFTRSSDFPVSAGSWRGQISSPANGDGSFVLEMNATGTALLYSTFFDPVRTNGITVDGSGNVYLTGDVFGPRLTTTPNARQPTFAGGVDAFVASLDASGSSLRYSTYLGGSSEDSGRAIQVDPDGHAWITGWSWSTDFPLARPIQSQLAGRACPDVSLNPSPYRAQPCGDAFLAEVSQIGDNLLYSTYFGGSRGSTGMKLQLDSSGNVWMLGTGSLGFITQNAWLAGPCNNATENSAPAAEFSPTGSLLYASYVSASLSVLVPSGTVRTLFGTAVMDILSPGSMRFSCMLNSASLAGFASSPLSLDPANVAKYAGIIAPGEIVSIFGGGLGPDAPTMAASSSIGIAPQLAGVEVRFNGIPAPLLYVQNSQIMAVVPYEIASASTGGATAEVQVRHGNQTSPALIFLIDATSPGVYSLDSSGVGQAAALNQDGSLNGPDNPASKGDIVSIYATGGGLTNPLTADGSMNTGISTTLQLPVRVRFSAPVDAELLYAGPAPTLVSGAIQINARIPPQTASGDHVPVSLYVGEAFSSGSVTIAVK
jgi:uncharacterized protein (TIGR03437 family)